MISISVMVGALFTQIHLAPLPTELEGTVKMVAPSYSVKKNCRMNGRSGEGHWSALPLFLEDLEERVMKGSPHTL